MLGSLLGAHSDCIVTPESQFKIPCLRALEGEPDTAMREKAVEALRKHLRFLLWDLDIDPREGFQHTVDGPSLLSWVVQEYARSRGKPKATIWIDHTGGNSRYAPRLLTHFPNARFIHLVRDGRGVAASVIPLDWGPNSVQRAAHWWTEWICHGLASEDFLQDRAIRVTFEEVVNSPEDTLRELCGFLEIPFESRMLAADGFDVPEFTRAQHRLIGEAPDPTRAVRWKSQLSPREIEIFEALTGDLLVALGYEPEYGASANPVGWSERLHAYAIEAVRALLLNRIRHRIRMQRSISKSGDDTLPERELTVTDSHAAV